MKLKKEIVIKVTQSKPTVNGVKLAKSNFHGQNKIIWGNGGVFYTNWALGPLTGTFWKIFI